MESTDPTDYLSSRDRAVLDATVPKPLPWQDTRGPGERPVVLAIDLQRHLFGDDVPIVESVSGYRTSMGSVAYRALASIGPLLETARESGVPVVYTRVIPGPTSGFGPEDVDIVDEVAPVEGETVLDKSYSSAFYGTDLVSRLVRTRRDTVVVLGCSASGCVRSTMLDAAQHGFRVLAPRECVFDRVQASTAITLLDASESFAEVWPTSEVQAYLAEVAA
jgi:nicotinamidase-related amidase